MRKDVPVGEPYQKQRCALALVLTPFTQPRFLGDAQYSKIGELIHATSRIRADGHNDFSGAQPEDFRSDGTYMCCAQGAGPRIRP